MKKRKIKNIILFTVIFTIIMISVMALPVIVEGIDLYSEAVSEMSIEEKVSSIRTLPNYVELDKIPKCLQNATISVEDHRFYKHNGFDIKSTCRAFLTNIKTGKIVSGGSTITQQLAKNMFFSFKKTYSRKVAELIVAIQLEEKYSKEEILELYMNIIYYGNNYYGIKEAANGYFNVNPEDLTDEQSILLAGIPQSPNYYSLANPICNIKDRATTVLNSMIEHDYIDSSQAKITEDKTLRLIESLY